jgi:hypothetical protein
LLEPTLLTWILVAFGIVYNLLILGYVQIQILAKPDSQKTKDLLIGKGQDWRDKSHRRFSYGVAWSDFAVWFPLLLAGSIGVLLGKSWGYALWAASGAISVYINFILWFSERAYVYPSCGPLVYYTYYWGFFTYWGLAVVVYSVIRLAG